MISLCALCGLSHCLLCGCVCVCAYVRCVNGNGWKHKVECCFGKYEWDRKCKVLNCIVDKLHLFQLQKKIFFKKRTGGFHFQKRKKPLPVASTKIKKTSSIWNRVGKLSGSYETPLRLGKTKWLEL